MGERGRRREERGSERERVRGREREEEEESGREGERERGREGIWRKNECRGEDGEEKGGHYACGNILHQTQTSNI